MDGIARAIEELESVHKHFKEHNNPLSAAFIDLRKAFDSVSFKAIYDALQRLGVPNHFINYVKFIYSNASTFLVFDGNVSQPIHPTRGVRQGDPLSLRHLSLLYLILSCGPSRSDLVRSCGSPLGFHMWLMQMTFFCWRGTPTVCSSS